MTRRSGWTLGALALGALLGCEDPYYAGCTSDDECGAGYACQSLGGTPSCVPPCATDDDCAVVEDRGDVYCAVIGACVLACTADVDCPANAMCDPVAGACVGRGR